jgi:hypothetical protein
MMTHGVSWQIAYSIFIAGMIAIGILTYVSLRNMENRRIKNHRKDNQ